MNIEKSTIVVTGVSRGIGRATVEHLLSRGAKVMGWGRTNPGITHPAFAFVEVDVRDAQSVKAAAAQASTQGPVHGLVNNAGLGIFKPIEELSLDDWNRMFDTNVKGMFLVTQSLLPLLRAQRGSHIVNIASSAGKEGIPEATAYCGTKFAVRGFSMALYKEVRKQGVKVSIIYPGSVNTDFFDAYEAVTANPTMMTAEEVGRMIVELLSTSDNFAPLELEIRPVQVSYRP